ncbi:MAG: lamin tail domain-containing protein, partial [Bacteroidota bacterium]|nr:lamin tail domain-containing protein [Bacteroidota bacterium]
MAEERQRMFSHRFNIFYYLRKPIFPAAVFFFHITATAQINEDFLDSDLISNPCWSGDLAAFEVNSYHQLHLKTTGAATSYLSTPLNCSQGMKWEFWTRLSFSPSENNYSRIYLLADSANPLLSGKAFYIQLGEALSQDAITLFHKDGTALHEVCRGTAGLVANPLSIRIRVVRLNNGTWKISADPTGASLFSSEASGMDNAPLQDGYFAISCKYTSSNSTGFYFTGIHVCPFTDDTSPPRLLQATVTRNSLIQLDFNEPIEKATSLQVSNFSLTDGTHPFRVYADPLTGTTIWLEFGKPLPADQSFELILSGVTDLEGNSMPQNKINLHYHPTRAFDVLISEIMANPVPSNGLPESEYLELYNRTPFPISFTNWTLQTGKKEQSLPDSVIAPHQYVIITASSNVQRMKKYGKVIPVNTLVLANTGCIIALRDRNRQIIHALDYTPAWHDDKSKKSGGWSLEMIDPENPCGESANYRSSVNLQGGTPGSVNSVNGLLPDLTTPQLLSAFPTDNLHLRICFSETMDTIQLSGSTAYSIEPAIGNPGNVVAEGPLYHSAILELPMPLMTKTAYTLTVNEKFKDCAGNQLTSPSRIQFGLPLPLKKNSVVINEIMFDPKPDQEEFIELYNRSSEIHDLSCLYVKVENTASSKKPGVKICTQGRLIFPGEYQVLTSDKRSFTRHHPLLPLNVITEVTDLPILPNLGGTITLSDSTGTILDQVEYTPAMHFQLLRSTSGVSLERVDPDGASDSKDNWQSAAEISGFSTPGRINSQHSSQTPGDVSFTLEPEQFTPDNDGKDDNLLIKYKPEKPGSIMTILIYDIKGKLIRQLASNVLLASENT